MLHKLIPLTWIKSERDSWERFTLNSRHVKTKSFARARSTTKKFFVNNKHIYIFRIIWNEILARLFKMVKTLKNKLFSFGNGPWCFTLVNYRSRISLLSSFSFESWWKLNSGEFLQQFEQFTATHESTFFPKYVCIYPEYINDHNTNFAWLLFDIWRFPSQCIIV